VGEKLLGTFGAIGAFSTHERKLICTGEGGFLLTDDRELYERLLEVRAFGRMVQAREGLEAYRGKFGAVFGFNFKLNALAAALGLSQLAKLEERIAKRRANAEAILREIRTRDLPWLREIPVPQGSQSNYYALVLEVEVNPDLAPAPTRQVAERLAERGVLSDTLEYDYRPLYELPLFRDYATMCPNAKALTERVIVLPTHEGLTPQDLELIVEGLRSLTDEL